MARVLVIYNRQYGSWWMLSSSHGLDSLRRYSEHEVLYLNLSRRRVPRYVRTFDPDLVVFHHSFLLLRQRRAEFERLVEKISFIRNLSARAVLIAQDEQVRMDASVEFIRDFGVSVIFSPAPERVWPRMYAGVDSNAVRILPILNGYIDDDTALRIRDRADQLDSRAIDIGYRTWFTQPFYGRHGQMKQAIARRFAERAQSFGLMVDIATDVSEALWGERWLDFLLKSKYTIGVEGGCSVFDWDGEIARKTQEFVAQHEDASFEEIEAACFPGLDGGFDCFTLSPRHLEAVMTKTCQVLVEGEYAGILKPGEHYIELQRDFGNLDLVLEAIKADAGRAEMVDRAYRDVVASGRYSYRAFVDQVFAESLSGLSIKPVRRSSAMVIRWSRADEAIRRFVGSLFALARQGLRQFAIGILGESRYKRLRARRLSAG